MWLELFISSNCISRHAVDHSANLQESPAIGAMGLHVERFRCMFIHTRNRFGMQSTTKMGCFSFREIPSSRCSKICQVALIPLCWTLVSIRSHHISKIVSIMFLVMFFGESLRHRFLNMLWTRYPPMGRKGPIHFGILQFVHTGSVNGGDGPQ